MFVAFIMVLFALYLLDSLGSMGGNTCFVLISFVKFPWTMLYWSRGASRGRQKPI